MATERIIPGEIRIFLNHIYEFKKGVRNMVLYTMSREHEEFAIRRLKNQKISLIPAEQQTKGNNDKGNLNHIDPTSDSRPMHLERRQKKNRGQKRRLNVFTFCHKGKEHQLHG